MIGSQTGLFISKIIIRKDLNNCLKLAEIVKDYKLSDLKNLYKNKLEYVANYYFNNEDFTKAYEYYQAFIKEDEYANKDVFYNMSKILLEGLGGISKDIKLSEIYYLKGLIAEISDVIYKALIKYRVLNDNQLPKMQMQIKILANGQVSNISIIQAPDDKSVIPRLVQKLSEYTFPNIPKQYHKQEYLFPIHMGYK